MRKVFILLHGIYSRVPEYPRKIQGNFPIDRDKNRRDFQVCPQRVPIHRSVRLMTCGWKGRLMRVGKLPVMPDMLNQEAGKTPGRKQLVDNKVLPEPFLQAFLLKNKEIQL